MSEKQDLTFWTGPVWKGDVPDAFVPGTKELFIGCLGDRLPLCPAIGDQLQGSLDALMSQAKMSRDELGTIYMGAFSAGGSLLKRLLTNPEYRDATTSVLLADATYTSSWDDPSRRIPPVMYGFIDYCMDVLAAGGDKLFISSASVNPNKDWATGIENIQRLRAEIELRSGRTFERLSHFWGVTTPARKTPEYVWKLDNVIFAECSGDSDFGHGHPVMHRQIWQKILIPWLNLGKGVLDGGSEQVQVSAFGSFGSITKYIPALAGVAAGFVTVRALTRNKR